MGTLESVAVFADCGVSAHQAQYRKAGALVAHHGARLICVARQGQWPRAIVDSALADGGKVTVVGGADRQTLDLPQGVAIDRFESDAEAAAGAVRMARAVLGLPAGIDTVGALYAAWAQAGGAQSGRPVGLLNRERAYEVVKGFMSDVAGPGRGNVEKLVQFSDNLDDLWHRLSRMI